jgi:hypothetical protein
LLCKRPAIHGEKPRSRLTSSSATTISPTPEGLRPRICTRSLPICVHSLITVFSALRDPRAQETRFAVYPPTAILLHAAPKTHFSPHSYFSFPFVTVHRQLRWHCLNPMSIELRDLTLRVVNTMHQHPPWSELAAVTDSLLSHNVYAHSTPCMAQMSRFRLCWWRGMIPVDHVTIVGGTILALPLLSMWKSECTVSTASER